MTKHTVIAAGVSLAGIAAGAGLMLSSTGAANAGTGPGGYAQTAQTALTKAGAPFGYKTRCAGAYSNFALATVKVTCTMTETP